MEFGKRIIETASMRTHAMPSEAGNNRKDRKGACGRQQKPPLDKLT